MIFLFIAIAKRNQDEKFEKLLNMCVYDFVIIFFSGFILMIKLFSAGGSKIAIGIIVMIVTLSFAIIALADGLLLIKVRFV